MNRPLSASLRKLRIALGAFFLTLAIPTAFLVWKTYDQLRFESFFQHRQQAESLTGRVDGELVSAISELEAYGFADFSFVVIEGEPTANFLQRSDLSAFPVNSPIPGLLGYFQVDAEGLFSTPFLPVNVSEASSYGLSVEEQRRRGELENRILSVLSDNRLVARSRQLVSIQRSTLPAADSPEAIEEKESRSEGAMASVDSLAASAPMELGEEQPQARFDELAKRETGKDVLADNEPALLDELVTRYEQIATESRDDDAPEPVLARKIQQPQRAKRREQTILPGRIESDDLTLGAGERSAVTLNTFSSELDPFAFSLLDSGHFVLFRNVWRENRRLVQGAVIEQAPFVQALLQPFAESSVFAMSQMSVAYQDQVLANLGGEDQIYTVGPNSLDGALLYRSRLTAPLDNLELLFTISYLPVGPGGKIVGWVGAVLFLLLASGSFVTYRLGSRQIALARQQQDFVSAVSHELKTPLTSIRMYGEMLMQGWASEEKRQTYYEYIFDESERLSRLIANVLQLARMNRNELEVTPQSMAVSTLMDLARSKVASQIERAGFAVEFLEEDGIGEKRVHADEDAFCQILINLIDNALKFSAQCDDRRIQIRSEAREGGVMFAVRDFGPGIAKHQMKKIFELFYRAENEMTRETVGTGIGLALVERLVRAMGGRVDVVNTEPGAEFRVWLASAPH